MSDTRHTEFVTNSDPRSKALARAVSVIDVVVLAIDAVVIGAVILVAGVGLVAGTDSWFYANTGGLVYALVVTPGVTRLELVVYALVGVAIAGPVWHSLVRPSVEPTEPSSLADTSASESEPWIPAASRNRRARHVSNGGVTPSRRGTELSAEGPEWISTVFDETRSRKGVSTSGQAGSTATPEHVAREDGGTGRTTPAWIREQFVVTAGGESDEGDPDRSRSDGDGRTSDPDEVAVPDDRDADPGRRIRAVVRESRVHVRALERAVGDARRRATSLSVEREPPLADCSDERIARLQRVQEIQAPTIESAVESARAKQRDVESAIDSALHRA